MDSSRDQAPYSSLTFEYCAPRTRDTARAVRILLVDDDANDRALATRELHREIPNLLLIEVKNEEEFGRAFSGEAPDLIITDFQLYWSNGLRLIERFKRRWPDVPVIMFTGSGSEEIAVQAMKNGVYDYVLKNPRHFARLRTSVHLALKNGARIRELTEAEARYKSLFETVPVGLFRCTPTGQILDANRALASIVGMSDRNQLLHANFADLHPTPGEFTVWREALEREGSVAFVECRFKTGNGQLRWAEIHARALHDPNTRQIHYEGSVEDISARKHAEEEREKLITELRDALAKVKTLSGLLPICANCKQIRDEQGAWNMVEIYIEQHSHAHFTHSYCPECVRRLYPEIFVDSPRIYGKIPQP